MSILHDELATLSPERRELLERLLERQGLGVTALPIPRRQLQQAPLSYTQERLWQIGRIAEATPLGNVPLAFHIHGDLDVPALERTLNYLVGRHDILRTRFDSVDQQVCQLVEPSCNAVLRVTDLRTLPLRERRERAEHQMRREAARPFTLTQAPLLRAELWQLDAEEHILLVLLHHLVVDGFAIRVLLRELSEAYAAICRGREPALPPPPIQYGDFAVWQRESLRGETLDRLVSFWERELAGFRRAIFSPSRRASGPSLHGGACKFAWSREFSDQLRAVCRSEGVTLFMLTAAALHVLERAYTCEDDVQIGTTISCRTRPETEELIGNLGSSVVLRVDLSGDPTLREVLARERRVVTAVQGHQELSLELLVDELQRRGSATRVPPIRTMLIVRDSSVGEHVEVPGLTLDRLHVDLGVAWLDLSIDIVEADEIHGSVEYRRDSFDDVAIDSFIADLRTVLEHFATDSETRLSTLPPFAIARGSAPRPEMAEFVPPRTDVERRMAEIWQRVLKTGPISVRAGFFELGGHSLLVGQLVHEIEQRFGQSVSPQTLFEHPTIEMLTDVLTASAPPVRVASYISNGADPTKPAIFAIHAGDDFDALTKLLPPDQPFWRLTAQGGLDGRRRPYHPAESVEDLAGLYVERVKACSPKRPYLLMGHCFGGLVAFEMARQLKEDVGAVVVVDGFPFIRRSPDPDSNSRIGRHMHRLIEMNLRDRVRYLSEKTSATLRWHRARLQTAQDYLAIECACRWHLARGRPIPAELLRERFTWMAAQMLRRYEPAPLPGRVLLLHTDESNSPGAEAWRDLAHGGLEAHAFATTHHGLLHSPIVEHVTAILSEYVARHWYDRTSSPRPEAIVTIETFHRR